MAPIRGPETRLTHEGGLHRLSRNVGDYQATLRNITEGRRHRGRSQKSSAPVQKGTGKNQETPEALVDIPSTPRTPPEGVRKQIKNSTTSISPAAITAHSLAVFCTTVLLYTADVAVPL
jgi:hypothetical protein